MSLALQRCVHACTAAAAKGPSTLLRAAAAPPARRAPSDGDGPCAYKSPRERRLSISEARPSPQELASGRSNAEHAPTLQPPPP